jgi:hypothetical protein
MSEPIGFGREVVEDDNYPGMTSKGITDETLLSIMEGSCEEIGDMNFESYANCSPVVISKAYNMVHLVMGSVGHGLTRAYREL